MVQAKRHKHHSAATKPSKKCRRRQSAAGKGRWASTVRRKSLRFGPSKAAGSVPEAAPPLGSDTVSQMAAGPNRDYPPKLNQFDAGFLQQCANLNPDILSSSLILSPNLRLLRHGSGNLLLIETGSAVTHLMDLRDGVDGVDLPSDRAHVRAHQMLADLTYLNLNTAATDVYSDPDGAIRLLWSRDDRSVELVFPSIVDEAPYLYHSDEHIFGVEERPSPQCALEWIHWVLDDVLPRHVRAA